MKLLIIASILFSFIYAENNQSEHSHGGYSHSHQDANKTKKLPINLISDLPRRDIP